MLSFGISKVFFVENELVLKGFFEGTSWRLSLDCWVSSVGTTFPDLGGVMIELVN